MKILGISSHYHDASAAIVIDGKVVASSAEERFTLQKHDPSFPQLSIEYCLEQAGIKASDLDLVVYHEDPHSKFTRSMASAFKEFPFSLKTFIKTSKDMMTGGFWIKNDISKYLNISPHQIVFIPHHMSHAAHAFLTSSFEEAAVLTIDAVGEWNTTGLFVAKKNATNFSLEPVEMIPFPHSLGLVYSAFTGFLGFKVNDGECSTMALSAFGKPRFVDDIKKIICTNEDGLYKIDLSYFDFSTDSKLPLTPKFTAIFGEPRLYKIPLPFDAMEAVTSISEENQRYADIACSLQIVLEDAILLLVKRIKKISGSDNLCYAGGVALNCVANSKIIEEKIFKNIYIPPDPGDGGGAMGAALYASLLKDKNTKPQPISAYMGKKFSSDELESMVPYVNPKDWAHFSRVKMTPIKKEEIKEFKIENKEELLSFVAKKIYEGKIVGWCQGRFENGPRALGNRSILCRPDSLEVARRLSKNIKLRAPFRPYACSLTRQEAAIVFTNEDPLQLEKWMQSSFKIKDKYIEKIRAAAHIDHTTRAQVVDENDNPLYFKLLNEYKRLSGHAALLNTSFNEQGFPIVASPMDAFVMFARTDLDILVAGNYILEKRYEKI